MRTATLITDLVRQEVRCGTFAEYRYFDPKKYILTIDENVLEPMEQLTVESVVVPITRFCRPGKPDVYIAYSREVEGLLGVPIRTLIKEKDEAIASLSRCRYEIANLRAMTAWQHIKAALRIILGRRL